MTDISAWRARPARTGQVDFLQMYAAHDAFVRDFARLANAVERGEGLAASTRAGWTMVTQQLRVHHTSEDSFLWPRLRAKELQPHEEMVVNAMEAEHAEMDPLLESVDKAFVAEDALALAEGVRDLRRLLIEHLAHEEQDALPLLERYLGQAGWAEFGEYIRDANGSLRGGATYLPWVLDGADPHVRARFLAMLPGPARVLYSKLWAPSYRRHSPWADTDGAR